MMIQMTALRNWRKLLMALLLLAAIGQFGSAAIIVAKARLAQVLIADAWQRSLLFGGRVEKPWPWADTWPVARLEVPRLGVDLFVLWGAQGNSLAFGPGYEPASAKPGREGVTVFGGHRDTHFRFLQDVKTNTLLSLQLPSGERKAYQVSGSRIVDTDREPYLLTGTGSNELLLVTCYPFDALVPGGPLRYVVSARPVLSQALQTQSGVFEL